MTWWGMSKLYAKHLYLCAPAPPAPHPRAAPPVPPPMHLRSRIHLSNCSFPDDLYQKVLWKNIVHIKRYVIR